MTAIGYFTSNPDNYLNGISINRPFYSTLTKWAWGADYLFHGLIDSAGTFDAPRRAYQLRYNDIDVWGGRSFPISLSNSIEARSTKLITSLRFLNRTYTSTLPSDIDSSHLFFNSQLYMTGIGISNRTYYRDYYIYRYGIPEDVPAGRIAELLFGYESGLHTGRLYMGAVAGFGSHFSHIGYLSLIGAYGTYLNKSKLEQSVVNTTMGYFSDLLTLGDWRVRQFVKVQCVYGIDRKSGELININEENGIKGFSSSSVTGTNKLILTLQSQIYLPYSLLGFRFAPFLFCNFGMVGSETRAFARNRLYQGYGLGLQIKNELLTINTFQISIGFYPFIPGVDNALYKYNAVKTYDFTFRDFDIEKPAAVLYE
jgi:hypothetical protein